jgi:hypothetical protein
MATIYVKKDGSGDATTIQQGIQIAQLGDIVEIEEGIFDENLDLWKGITLKGAGKDKTVVTSAQRSAISTKTFTWTLGSTILNISSGNTSDYEVGRIVTATGIPTNTRLVAKTDTTLEISTATTQVASTARAVNMTLQNLATVSIRGTNGIVTDMKFIGHDSPSPGIEYATVYIRNAGAGSVAANNWEIFNCEIEANGEYALLTDFTSAIGNINIHDNKFTGKTFVGANPGIGDQFSVPNVPRQAVVLQGPNIGANFFVNNEVTTVTGGKTIDNIDSYNTAVTFDAVGSVITGNTMNGDFGYGYGLRSRGLNSVIEDNTVVGSTTGYYILPNHSNNVLITVGTMVFNSSKYWICIQEHTSSASSAPTGVDGALYWEEITLQQVNDSGIYGVAQLAIGSNDNTIINNILEGIMISKEEEYVLGIMLSNEKIATEIVARTINTMPEISNVKEVLAVISDSKQERKQIEEYLVVACANAKAGKEIAEQLNLIVDCLKFQDANDPANNAALAATQSKINSFSKKTREIFTVACANRFVAKNVLDAIESAGQIAAAIAAA